HEFPKFTDDTRALRHDPLHQSCLNLLLGRLPGIPCLLGCRPASMVGLRAKSSASARANDRHTVAAAEGANACFNTSTSACSRIKCASSTCAMHLHGTCSLISAISRSLPPSYPLKPA